MRIGVIGLNGRMSKAVLSEIVNQQNCLISGALVRKKIENSNISLYENIIDLANNSDAIIDFSNPKTSIEVAEKLSNKNVVLVCGTTGFNEQEFDKLKQASKNLAIIYSPNMSLGINLLQKILKQITPILTDFDSAVLDIHHKHKKDSPSGTALMLANQMKSLSQKEVQISSLRIGFVPGEHKIIFSNEDESITIAHHAFNRNVFAKGAIKAAIWGRNKLPGLYSMEDIFI